MLTRQGIKNDIEMIKTVIDPGICGMTTVLEVTRTEKGYVSLSVTSACKNITAMADKFHRVNIHNVLKPID